MLYNDEEKIKNLLVGSLFLGGGGGGSPQEGFERAMSAINCGPVELISLEELQYRRKGKEPGYIVTFAGVGSPASQTAYYSDQVYPIIAELLSSHLDGPIIGVIPCEIGASSSFEPFIPAALLGVPIIDAPCDGRAHPLGTMGSLGLEHCQNYTMQSAAGGKENTDSYIQIFTQGTISHTASLIRNSASLAGGAVAVCRNPVTIDYLNIHGAKGAYTLAEKIGNILRKSGNSEAGISTILHELGGKCFCQGKVTDYTLSTHNALDYGRFTLSGHRISFCNEFMTVEKEGHRQYTFPDLITAFDAKNCKIISSAEVKNGQSLFLTAVPYENIPLGSGLRNPKHYKTLEESTHESFVKYLGPLFETH